MFSFCCRCVLYQDLKCYQIVSVCLFVMLTLSYSYVSCMSDAGFRCMTPEVISMEPKYDCTLFLFAFYGKLCNRSHHIYPLTQK